MTRYGGFCPIAAALDILGERWTLLIVRELIAGSTRFNELRRGLPRISSATLADRLRRLEDAGVVERRPGPSARASEYRLTEAGRDLREVVLLLGDWGKRWANVGIGPHNLDPDFLLWDMRRRTRLDRLPARRVVVRFDLTGACWRSYWLLLERPEPSLCLTDPGFEVDLTVVADTIALHRVWVGELDFAAALRAGSIVPDGPYELRRAFPGWLALSVYAERG